MGKFISVRFNSLFCLIIMPFVLFQTRGCVHGSDQISPDLLNHTAEQSDGQISRGIKSVRYCVQGADGYAVLSADRTDLEARIEAVENAKKNAVEKANAHIKSVIREEDFVIKPDIEILEQKDYGKEKDNRYHVYIKARVSYELKTVPLAVNVWTSKKTYKQGENIEIHIRGTKDYYAQIFAINPSGEKIQLSPYGSRPLNFVFKAGKIYKIPDDSELKAVPPGGKNQIVVYASMIPFKEQSVKEQIEEVVRSVAVVPPGCDVKIWEFTVEE